MQEIHIVRKIEQRNLVIDIVVVLFSVSHEPTRKTLLVSVNRFSCCADFPLERRNSGWRSDISVAGLIGALGICGHNPLPRKRHEMPWDECEDGEEE